MGFPMLCLSSVVLRRLTSLRDGAMDIHIGNRDNLIQVSISVDFEHPFIATAGPSLVVV